MHRCATLLTCLLLAACPVAPGEPSSDGGAAFDASASQGSSSDDGPGSSSTVASSHDPGSSHAVSSGPPATSSAGSTSLDSSSAVSGGEPSSSHETPSSQGSSGPPSSASGGAVSSSSGVEAPSSGPGPSSTSWAGGTYSDCGAEVLPRRTFSLAAFAGGVFAGVGDDAGSEAGTWRVEKYLGRGCELYRDGSFPTTITFPGLVNQQMATDARGHLYLPPGTDGVVRELTASGEVAVASSIGQPIWQSASVSPSGKVLMLLNHSFGGLTRWERSDVTEPFSSSVFVPPNSLDPLAVVPLDDGRVGVVGRVDPNPDRNSRLSLLSAQGALLQTFATQHTDGNCHAGVYAPEIGATACGADICVASGCQVAERVRLDGLVVNSVDIFALPAAVAAGPGGVWLLSYLDVYGPWTSVPGWVEGL